MVTRRRTLTRAEFLRLTGAAGGAALAASFGNPIFALQPRAAGPGERRADLALNTVADTVLYTGKVATMDAANTITQAVAVRDGLILRTGS